MKLSRTATPTLVLHDDVGATSELHWFVCGSYLQRQQGESTSGARLGGQVNGRGKAMTKRPLLCANWHNVSHLVFMKAGLKNNLFGSVLQGMSKTRLQKLRARSPPATKFATNFSAGPPSAKRSEEAAVLLQKFTPPQHHSTGTCQHEANSSDLSTLFR